jgi:hypothetical protein
MLNEKRKPENSSQPRTDKAVKLSGGLGAVLNNEQNKEIKICKDCIHSIDISGNKNLGVHWCNRKHKIDLIDGKPNLIPCYHERINSLFKCGEKAKYFISKQKDQETKNKTMQRRLIRS